MDLRYELKTTVYRTGIIEHTLHGADVQGKVREIHRKILNVEERQTREALIALGWTPPANRGVN